MATRATAACTLRASHMAVVLVQSVDADGSLFALRYASLVRRTMPLMKPWVPPLLNGDCRTMHGFDLVSIIHTPRRVAAKEASTVVSHPSSPDRGRPTSHNTPSSSSGSSMRRSRCTTPCLRPACRRPPVFSHHPVAPAPTKTRCFSCTHGHLGGNTPRQPAACSALLPTSPTAPSAVLTDVIAGLPRRPDAPGRIGIGSDGRAHADREWCDGAARSNAAPSSKGTFVFTVAGLPKPCPSEARYE